MCGCDRKVVVVMVVVRPGNSGVAWESRSQKQNRGDRNFLTEFTLFVGHFDIVAIEAWISEFSSWFYLCCEHPLENKTCAVE